MKIKTLTIKNLTQLFGVTAPTIYAWRIKLGLPQAEKCTPAAVKKWATKTSTTMYHDPAALLGTGIGKPGPKPKEAVVQKSALRIKQRTNAKSSVVQLGNQRLTQRKAAATEFDLHQKHEAKHRGAGKAV